MPFSWFRPRSLPPAGPATPLPRSRASGSASWNFLRTGPCPLRSHLSIAPATSARRPRTTHGPTGRHPLRASTRPTRRSTLAPPSTSTPTRPAPPSRSAQGELEIIAEHHHHGAGRRQPDHQRRERRPQQRHAEPRLRHHVAERDRDDFRLDHHQRRRQARSQQLGQPGRRHLQQRHAVPHGGCRPERPRRRQHGGDERARRRHLQCQRRRHSDLDSTTITGNTAVGQNAILGAVTAGVGEGGGIYNDLTAVVTLQNGSQVTNNTALGGTGRGRP